MRALNLESIVQMAGMTGNPGEHVSAIILAGGRATRWNDFNRLPKQMIRFAGETLLDRMIRLLHARGVTDVTLVKTRDEVYTTKPVQEFSNTSHNIVSCVVEMMHGRPGKTIWLLGDVYFSARAISLITGNASGVCFFGRMKPNSFSLKLWGEIFALSVSNKCASYVEHALKDLAGVRGPGAGSVKLWNALLKVSNYPPSGAIDAKVWCEINDETDDFDSPEEWLRAESWYEEITQAPEERRAEIYRRRCASNLTDVDPSKWKPKLPLDLVVLDRLRPECLRVFEP